MMRTRQIKPGFFKNEDLASLPPMARLLFAGLWLLSDREGRLEDRPARIKAELFPYEEANVDGLLNELAGHGFIIRYSAPSGHVITSSDTQAPGNGQANSTTRVIQVSSFLKHQRIHPHEAKSQLPACVAPTPGNVITSSDKSRDVALVLHSSSNTPPTPPRAERRSRVPSEATADEALPRGIDVPEFRTIWAAWRQHNEALGGFSPVTADLQLRELGRLAPDEAVAVVENSMRKGWKALKFPGESGGPDGPGPTDVVSEADREERCQRRRREIAEDIRRRREQSAAESARAATLSIRELSKATRPPAGPSGPVPADGRPAALGGEAALPPHAP